MNTPIFLNHNYYSIIKEEKIDLSQLSLNVLEDLLPINDFWELKNYNAFLLLPGHLLNRLGFVFQSNSEKERCYELSTYQDVVLTDSPLTAVCTPTNIILCEDRLHVYDEDENKVMCAEKQTLYHILIALKKIKTFEEIKNTKQFELFYLK